MTVKRHFFLFAVISAFIAVASFGRNALASDNLPEIYFYDKLDARVALQDFKGKTLLVNLWATWCPPCIRELPSLAALQEKFADQEFKVIALSLDNLTPDELERFLKKYGAENLEVYHDKDRQVPLKWSYKGLPTSYLLDATGKVVARFDGPREWTDGAIIDQIKASLPQ